MSASYYCFVNNSSRTAHVTHGDLLIYMNGQSLLVNNGSGGLDLYFESVVAKITASPVPRIARILRFFRTQNTITTTPRLSAEEFALLFDGKQVSPVAGMWKSILSLFFSYCIINPVCDTHLSPTINLLQHSIYSVITIFSPCNTVATRIFGRCSRTSTRSRSRSNHETSFGWSSIRRF